MMRIIATFTEEYLTALLAPMGGHPAHEAMTCTEEEVCIDL
jgi:hypothetical protein